MSLLVAHLISPHKQTRHLLPIIEDFFLVFSKTRLYFPGENVFMQLRETNSPPQKEGMFSPAGQSSRYVKDNSTAKVNSKETAKIRETRIEKLSPGFFFLNP